MSEPFQHVPGIRREFTSASPSQIKEYVLCHRKWLYTSIFGFRSTPNEKAQRGTDAHKELEDWYNDGIEPVTPQVRLSIQNPNMPLRENLSAQVKAFPEGERRILIEKWLPIILPSGITMRQKADLIDLSDPMCPVVIDHKTSGSFEYMLNEYQLRNDPQVLSYARAVLELYAPEAKSIRLAQNQISWGVLDVPRFVETTMSRHTVMRQWTAIENELIARMSDDAVKPISEVVATWDACKSYGGCPHLERCTSAMFDTLEESEPMRSRSSPFLNTLSEDLPLEVVMSKPKSKDEVIRDTTPFVQSDPIDTLFVDCLPNGVEVTYLSDLLHAPMAELARKTGIADWRLHEYGKGKGHVAAALKTLATQGKLPAYLYINTREDVSSVALEVLAPLASSHVYGTR